MRVLFLGSGPFGLPSLDRLAVELDELVVGTVPDAPRGRRGKPEPTVIKQRALEHRLEIREVDTLKGAHGPRFLEDLEVQLVITCDFRLILGTRFLKSPPLGCYNLHGSILPQHRGAAPVARALLAGDEEYGVTLYRMVYALDAGPVVDTSRFRPEEALNTEELESILSIRAADLLGQWLPTLLEGNVPLIPQDDEQATFAPKLEKSEGWIDWFHPAEQIERQIRALIPWPRAFSQWQSNQGGDPIRVFLDAARIETGAPSLEPGTVRQADHGGIEIACGPKGTDTIIATTLQRAGKRALSATDFLRGFPAHEGRFTPAPGGEVQ